MRPPIRWPSPLLAMATRRAEVPAKREGIDHESRHVGHGAAPHSAQHFAQAAGAASVVHLYKA